MGGGGGQVGREVGSFGSRISNPMSSQNLLIFHVHTLFLSRPQKPPPFSDENSNESNIGILFAITGQNVL